METFFRKEGETCELAPVTISLLVIGGGGKYVTPNCPLLYVFLMFQNFFWNASLLNIMLKAMDYGYDAFKTDCL